MPLVEPLDFRVDQKAWGRLQVAGVFVLEVVGVDYYYYLQHLLVKYDVVQKEEEQLQIVVVVVVDGE